MKRLSRDSLARREHLRRKRFRKAQRRRDVRYAHDLKLDVVFPEVFGFQSNAKATIETLRQIKEFGHSKIHMPKVVRLDMTAVQSASSPAILVLTAELDRLFTLHKLQNRGGFRVTLKRLMSWEKPVLARLHDMNFFALVGVRLSSEIEDHLIGEFAVMPMIACAEFLPERVVRLTTRLREAADFFEQSSYVYDAVIEAVHNATQHAYPPGHRFEFEPIGGAPWWATASYSEQRQEVRVVVFDQGVGIPATLPRWGLWEQVRGLLADGSMDQGLLKDDARMIQAALAVSRTSKEKVSGRGQGLQDVVLPVEDLKAGSLRILSGRGGILYKAGGDVELTHFDDHIGGTLIEWRVPILSSVSMED